MTQKQIDDRAKILRSFVSESEDWYEYTKEIADSMAEEWLFECARISTTESTEFQDILMLVHFVVIMALGLSKLIICHEEPYQRWLDAAEELLLEMRKDMGMDDDSGEFGLGGDWWKK